MAYSTTYTYTSKGDSNQVVITVNGRSVGVTQQYANDNADRDPVVIAAARNFWSVGGASGTVTVSVA